MLASGPATMRGSAARPVAKPRALRLGEQRQLEVGRGGGLLDGDDLHPEVQGLPHQQVHVRPSGGQADDGEPVGIARRHVERLGADGTGAAQHHDPTRVGHPQSS